jgi:N-acetyl-gamma-glutamyl-phosphate reductase
VTERQRVGLIGARGHVGAELLTLVWKHPQLELAYLGSRQLAGQGVEAMLPEAKTSGLAFEDLAPEEAARRGADVVFLALPNGLSEPYVKALRAARADVALVDLSADHRFVADWEYGLPEHRRARLAGAKAIANPGCYATAAQVALEPIRGMLAAAPSIFGVSGYSGAGTTPSPRNDVEALRDNLMPYALVGHVHEQEIARHLDHPVRFMPHVAPFFRGITLTIDCELRHETSGDVLFQRYRERYAGEPLVRVQEEAPLVRDAVGRHDVTVGGFTCGGTRAVMVATIDNLLKGAATQAVQNANLALGLPEHMGIPL